MNDRKLTYVNSWYFCKNCILNDLKGYAYVMISWNCSWILFFQNKYQKYLKHMALILMSKIAGQIQSEEVIKWVCLYEERSKTGLTLIFPCLVYAMFNNYSMFMRWKRNKNFRAMVWKRLGIFIWLDLRWSCWCYQSEISTRKNLRNEISYGAVQEEWAAMDLNSLETVFGSSFTIREKETMPGERTYLDYWRICMKNYNIFEQEEISKWNWKITTRCFSCRIENLTKSNQSFVKMASFDMEWKRAGFV